MKAGSALADNQKLMELAVVANKSWCIWLSEGKTDSDEDVIFVFERCARKPNEITIDQATRLALQRDIDQQSQPTQLATPLTSQRSVAVERPAERMKVKTVEENCVKKEKKNTTGQATLPDRKNVPVDGGSQAEVKKEKRKGKKGDVIVIDSEEETLDGGGEKEEKKKKKKRKIATESLNDANGSDVKNGNGKDVSKKKKKKQQTTVKNKSVQMKPAKIQIKKQEEEEEQDVKDKLPKKAKKRKDFSDVSTKIKEQVKEKKTKKTINWNTTNAKVAINVTKKKNKSKMKVSENGVKLETPESEAKKVKVKKKKKKEANTKEDGNELGAPQIKGNDKQTKEVKKNDKKKQKSTKSEIIIIDEEEKTEQKKKGKKEKVRKASVEVSEVEETEPKKKKRKKEIAKGEEEEEPVILKSEEICQVDKTKPEKKKRKKENSKVVEEEPVALVSKAEETEPKKKKRKKGNSEGEEVQPMPLKCEEVKKQSGETFVTAAGDTTGKKSKKKKSSIKVETQVESFETGAKKKIKEEVEDHEEHEFTNVDVVFLSEKTGNADEITINQERRQALQMEIDKASQPQKSAKPTGLGQWSTAQFDSSEQQQKFLRLMGGFKKGFQPAAEGSGKANMALGKDAQMQLQQGLLGEFERAQSRRMDFGNRGSGLGFTAPSNKKFAIDINSRRSVRFDD